MTVHLSPYLHILDGRLRIKIPHMKGSPQRALAVEQLLRGLDGVTDVTASSTTGNVLVLFTSTALSQHAIMTVLREHGYLRGSDHASEQDRKSLTSIVVQSAVELALERLMRALI